MRTITKSDFLNYLNEEDELRKTLQKVRTCFFYRNKHFTIDTNVNVPGNVTVLKTASNSDDIELPPFIPIIRELGNEQDFYSH